jgi:purine-binding chemotaxis protein CheW
MTDATRIPLAGPEIAGVLNLRGRIVTVIDLASRLSLDASTDAHMVIGIERGTESFGILVDRVGEVLSFSDRDREPAPSNLDPILNAVATGVFRLDDRILVALDAGRTLDFQGARTTAPMRRNMPSAAMV